MLPQASQGAPVSTNDPWEACGSILRSEEHTSELQSQSNLECRLLLEQKTITDKLGRLRGGLDSDDRARLNEYVENVREIERRIQKAAQQSATHADVPPTPAREPDTFE